MRGGARPVFGDRFRDGKSGLAGRGSGADEDASGDRAAQVARRRRGPDDDSCPPDFLGGDSNYGERLWEIRRWRTMSSDCQRVFIVEELPPARVRAVDADDVAAPLK